MKKYKITEDERLTLIEYLEDIKGVLNRILNKIEIDEKKAKTVLDEIIRVNKIIQ